MKWILATLLAGVLIACGDKKTALLEPQMEYIYLQDVTVGYNQMRRFDLDGNGTYDLRFTTYHIGDPLLQMDKIQFCAISSTNSYLPINADDNVTPLQAGDKIVTRNTEAHDWYQISLVVLAQKNLTNTAPPNWTGVWKEAQHKYLPVQLDRQGKRYNGWVELSFDMMAEKIILHRAAINKVAQVDIVAGQ